MPGGLTPADRRLLGWAAVFGVVLVTGIVATAPPRNQQYSPVPSVYSAGTGGARAAYLLLLDLKYNVHVLEEPPAFLTASASRALLILAEPFEAPSAADRAALLNFVTGGGRVLFCGASIPAFFSEAKVTEPLSASTPLPFSPDLPSAVSRGAERVLIRPQSYWKDLGPSQIRLYGAGGAAAIVSWRIGDGEVLWWAGATPLTNGGIRQAENLNLFLNTISASTSGGSSPVYWDEYFHGERTSLLSYFERTPVAWGAGQILLAAVVLVFSFSRRSGPVVMPLRSSRLSPLEFVDTMGALYQHAGAFSIPVEVSYRHLRLELTRRLGLPSGIPDNDLARIASERLGFDGNALAEALVPADPVVRASGERKLSRREALSLVQRLEALFARLTAPGTFLKENN